MQIIAKGGEMAYGGVSCHLVSYYLLKYLKERGKKQT
jgi:hypothetical protein